MFVALVPRMINEKQVPKMGWPGWPGKKMKKTTAVDGWGTPNSNGLFHSFPFGVAFF